MNRPSFTLVAIVAALIAGVYAIDVALERAEASETQHEARRLYETGSKLMAAGKADQALDPLQRAWTMDRGNRGYQLAYAEALTGSRHYEEAAALLDDVIRQAPNDGRANLLLARLARAQNDFGGETAYYHRAIFGSWSGDAEANATGARLEWIHELVSRGDRRLLLGELLQLEGATQNQTVLQEVARDFIIAGSPARAADLYRSLLATSPDNPALEEGLGQAETANGDYAQAQRAYVRALRASPGDPSVRRDMQLASALSEIDPTPRRLPSREKYQRSLAVLRLVDNAVATCGADSKALADAEHLLALKKPDTSNEASEQVLQMAESLWRQRPASCPSPEVLPALMDKLAR